METCINTLKKKIGNLSDDIDVIQRRLSDDIGKIYEDEINPMMIMEEMENIKNDLKKIKRDFDYIYQKKKMCASMLYKQLQNYHFLSDVEEKLDKPVNEFETYKRGEQMLSDFFCDEINQFLTNFNVEDIKETILLNMQQNMFANGNTEHRILENGNILPSSTKSDIVNNNNSGLQNDQNESCKGMSGDLKEQSVGLYGNMERNDVNNSTNEQEENEKEMNKNRDKKTPFLFTPIDEKTFLDVPVLTRRRAKLQDVNKVYETLYELAIKAGCCKTIEKSELQQMNLQVYGQTGEAKLATLRYLKIIEITNKNKSVRLLRCAGIKKKKKLKGDAKLKKL